MGLGPKWEGHFVQPAPPAGASGELRRYIDQLHDQLITSFIGAKDVINRLVIGGDGDGGPGMSGDTETDGGTIPTNINIEAETSWGGSKHQWIDDRAGKTSLNTAVGSSSSWGGLKRYNPTTSDQNYETSFFAIKAWNTAYVWYLMDDNANNGEDIDITFKYSVGNVDGVRWRLAGSPGFTSVGPANFTPAASTTTIIKLTFASLVGIVAGEQTGIQIVLEGSNPNQDQDIFLMGIQFATV